jgi:hypothetical protein
LGSTDSSDRERGCQVCSLLRAIPLSLADFNAATAAHFIPKSCFALGHALFDEALLEEVRRVGARGGLATFSVTCPPNEQVMTEVAHLSDEGPYCGVGVPDPVTWTMRKHMLDWLTALAMDPTTPDNAPVAVPLGYIRDNPEDVDSYPCTRNVLAFLARSNIQIHYGAENSALTVQPLPSERGRNMDALHALPSRFAWRALNVAETAQLRWTMTSGSTHAYGPLTKSHPQHTVNEHVLPGTTRGSGWTSYSASQFAMAHFAAYGVRKGGKRLVVLVDLDTFTGPVVRLTTPAERSEQNLQPQAVHFASRAQEVLVHSQPVRVRQIGGFLLFLFS